MKSYPTIYGIFLLIVGAVSAAKHGLPVDKIYGVNLGSWLLSEPWMFPEEWKSMGGEACSDCSKCAASEFALTQKLGQEEANKVFAKHWSTWFTQESVDAIADANLNTVRIPLGYWIVEPLVNRTTEFYPRGGLKYLKQGLRMLKAKGINVILDLHALPGVSAANQMFAGRCTSDIQFYTRKNYRRALVWAAVMTAVSHLDPDFSTVFAIQAINEPVMDAQKTPGLGEYNKNFAKVVRAVELALGITCSDTNYSPIFSKTAENVTLNLGFGNIAEITEPAIASVLKKAVSHLPSILNELGLSSEVGRVLGILDSVQPNPQEAVTSSLKPSNTLVTLKPSGAVAGASSRRLLHRRHSQLSQRKKDISVQLSQKSGGRCLMTCLMNKDWQYNNPANPADAAMGPQVYDAHLYFAFGWVAEPNAESYMRTICNIDRVAKATAANNRPLFFGEWSLATNFNASKEFLRDWADAQRLIYGGQAEGWIFWNFKVEKGSVYSPAWSYLDSLEAGYFTRDPSKLINPNVCAPWITKST